MNLDHLFFDLCRQLGQKGRHVTAHALKHAWVHQARDDDERKELMEAAEKVLNGIATDLHPNAIPFHPADLDISYYFTPQQKVNEQKVGVNIKHLPTGAEASCGEHSSQLKNKDEALALLRVKVERASG